MEVLSLHPKLSYLGLFSGLNKTQIPQKACRFLPPASPKTYFTIGM